MKHFFFVKQRLNKKTYLLYYALHKMIHVKHKCWRCTTIKACNLRADIVYNYFSPKLLYLQSRENKNKTQRNKQQKKEKNNPLLFLVYL